MLQSATDPGLGANPFADGNYYAENRLRVVIEDAEEMAYQIPESVLPQSDTHCNALLMLDQTQTFNRAKD
ncbi:hypothetical protein MKZ38_006677 [Zalerion maritima]|uniref:Uncharacterized protein n=1 Tax=Zalerion maritima TaxID=339359 RepID=A0AAD5RX19_9PEZI|nr:hypothetical protein MKZ38_006677 [Zalerion maritima]